MPKQPTKIGSDHATSGPLFISPALFALFPAHILTLLLIGGRLFSSHAYQYLKLQPDRLLPLYREHNHLIFRLALIPSYPTELRANHLVLSFVQLYGA